MLETLGHQETQCKACGRRQWVSLAITSLVCRFCQGNCRATGRVMLPSFDPGSESHSRDIGIYNSGIDMNETYAVRLPRSA